MNIRFLFCALITAVSAVISLGFSVAAAFNTANEARNMALYTGGRSVALVIVSAVSFLTDSTPWLEASASSMINVQICEAGIGAIIKDRTRNRAPEFCSSDLIAELTLLVERPMSIAGDFIARVRTVKTSAAHWSQPLFQMKREREAPKSDCSFEA
jgi:hypothetical protein